MARTKTKKEPKSPFIEDEPLLAQICDLSLEMKRLRGLISQHKKLYDALLEEAVGRKLNTVGRYCLILKPKTTRLIDVPTVLSMYPIEDVAPYLTMSLKAAGKIMSAQQIEEVSQEVHTDTWFVADKHGPWDRGNDVTMD